MTLKSLENAYEFLTDKNKIKEKITFKDEIIEAKVEENKDAKKEGKWKNFNNLKFYANNYRRIKIFIF